MVDGKSERAVAQEFGIACETLAPGSPAVGLRLTYRAEIG